MFMPSLHPSTERMILFAVSYGTLGALLVRELYLRKKMHSGTVPSSDGNNYCPWAAPSHVWWSLFLLGLIVFLTLPSCRIFAWICMLSAFTLAGSGAWDLALRLSRRYRMLLHLIFALLCLGGVRHPALLAPAIVVALLDTSVCSMTANMKKEQPHGEEL